MVVSIYIFKNGRPFAAKMGESFPELMNSKIQIGAVMQGYNNGLGYNRLQIGTSSVTRKDVTIKEYIGRTLVKLPQGFQGIREHGQKVIGNKGKNGKSSLEQGNKSCV